MFENQSCPEPGAFLVTGWGEARRDGIDLHVLTQ